MGKTKRGIVTGQRVTTEKVERSRALRRNMTLAERLLWEHLRGNQPGGLRFRRQQIIDGFIVDFYCHAAGLVVEIDGSVHNEQQAYDAERDCVLRARGLRVLRVTNEDVQQRLDDVLEQIGTASK